MVNPQGISTDSDDDIVRIWKIVLDLGIEIKQFRAALESYQSKIRRTLIQTNDAAVQNVGGQNP